MKKPPNPSDEQMQTGCDAVVELALMAFAPEWQRWTPDVNCAAVQFAWNSSMPGEEVLASGSMGRPDPGLERLIAMLDRERRSRWPTLACMVFDLAVRIVKGEIVFT